ncbi:MAG: 23S rRNA (adenine(2503)-C(2))-methyltransferase RlmN [Saprospiraceae bacterium]|nr:23S rRNA (adenine(2503)-C(2))-methyltransferase RlmN [Saprospiraceae bacterium]
MNNSIKTDIRRLSQSEIKNFILTIGQPGFRAKQIYEWLWQKGATTFDEMTNLPKELRILLSDHFIIHTIQSDIIQNSEDGTIKTRFILHDGNKVESVLIPVPADRRYTLCVSTQVGCSLACQFCATGQMRRTRNLDASEIYDQFVQVNQQCLDTFDHPLTNVVYMGMGEPLLAYSSTMDSIKMLTSPEGLNMSPKRITVSTAGIVKMIYRMADEGVKFNLAISLHAADNEKRSKIMPINNTNKLEDLIDALQYFYQKTGNKISFEYIAFKNFNDSLEDAENLVQLCKRFPVVVNIIEYNHVAGVPLEKADDDKINRFALYLRRNEIMCTVRRSRGKDIDAACGQLANKN